MGQEYRPSDVRRVFQERIGLSINDLLAGGFGIAARFFVWAANDEQHLSAPNRLAQAVTDRGRLHPALLSAVKAHVTASLDDLGQRLSDEMRAAGWAYGGIGTTPTYDTRSLADRPILLLDDDGAWAPLGLGLLADRLVELPRSVVVEDGRLGNARTVGGLVGYMFEAAVSDLMTSLHNRHHVLSEHEIVAAIGSRAGADGVIGYGNTYVVVEASVQTLGMHVAAGSALAVRRRCGDYRRKAGQAEETLGRLSDIARFHGRPTPESITFLVVTDLPISFNPAVAAELRSQEPGRNPKFVCSLEEFEWLCQLGDMGWAIPSAVLNWQARPTDAPLSDQLERMSKIAGAGIRWRFDLQAWLDVVPVEVQDAA